VTYGSYFKNISYGLDSCRARGIKPSTTDTWKVLIVDVDDEVHTIIRLSLTGFLFEEKGIEFISAYSGDEAKKLLAKHDDIALVLLDVVMGSDDAGLMVANYIRNDLGNHYTRVILRTGQAGFGHVNDVIRDYDIDGYLSKTKISKQSLDQTFYIALRSYRDLARIQKYQQGLGRIIGAIANLSQINQVVELSQAVISQLNSVLGAQQNEFAIQGADIFALTQNHNDTWRIIINEQHSMLLDKNKHQAKLHACNSYIELSQKGLA
jgi:CheY-like chemotaxis protein